MELKYLKSLARQYPNIAAASTEIINLQAILNLPKGTEHFLTDIHGEYEQFAHVLKNGSGAVRRTIDEVFENALSNKDKKSLATLIYYPVEKLDIVISEEDNIEDWYKITLHRLVQITKKVASKYTRSKVRKALPKDFAYIIEELITEKADISDKEGYYNEIIHTIIRIGRAQDFIIALSNLIQRLVIDHLHIVGDIFDRGPGPHIILDTLINYHSVDIQWGNHDILWMGAACGQLACIATVIRIAARYGSLDTLEDGYGINLIPLATFALDTYSNTNCDTFSIKYNTDYNTKDLSLDMKIHKAIAIMQFKLEGQLIRRHPEYGMDDRLLLEHIDYTAHTVTIDGQVYPLNDAHFPTVDPADPYRLSDGEASLMASLVGAFRRSPALRRHIEFLYTCGSLYRVCNGNLLFHGCIPLCADGSFDTVRTFDGQSLAGRAYMDFCDRTARAAFYDGGQNELDFMYYLWCGRQSPLFGRSRMTTFERYFVSDCSAWEEVKNPYYDLVVEYPAAAAILREFGLNERSAHIINGHVPVRAAKGEHPVRADGRYIRIDGGFCRAYHDRTGIAGYTLIYSSRGLRLVSHSPFGGKDAAIRENRDILASSDVVFEMMPHRMLVRDTDEGAALLDRMSDLRALLDAYREGVVSPD